MAANPADAAHTDPRALRRGFSLIELLVVITIIAIVIAITVPAIGAARDLARATATSSQIQSLVTAVGSFQADQDRVPGYFNAADMSDNGDGLTSMQNLILDLAGGTVGDDQGMSQNLPEVGPNNTAQVYVNTALIGIDGANSRSYLAADAVDFQSVEGKANVGNADNLEVPEIVDSWGMPIMAWTENEFAPEMNDLEMPEIGDFASEDADSAPNGASRFYWNQNQPLLTSNALGERQADQLSLSVLNDMDKSKVLTALLGSPASPTTSIRRGTQTANVSTFLPTSSKGSVLFQSAGRDRVYLSNEDKGFRQLGGNFEYPRYFSPAGTGRLGDNPWSNADDESGIKDIVSLFNDVVSSSAN